MTTQNINPDQHKKTSVILIVLIILVIATVLGGYFWKRFGKETSINYAATIAELQNKLTQEQVAIQSLQDQNAAQKREYAKTTSWKQIAIEHLIRMADLTLNTSRDVKTALAFLLEAKKYTSEAEELAISHALNKDIASLQAVPVADIEELVLKIDTISQQVDTLPVISPQITPASTASTTPEAQPTQMFNRLLTSIVKALKNIVIIRHHAIEPILPPQQITILRLNIQAKLLQAELAAMQRQNNLYQACLTQVIDLITKHFACNNTPSTAGVLQALQELQRINLQPELPTLTESLMAIQKAIQQKS